MKLLKPPKGKLLAGDAAKVAPADAAGLEKLPAKLLLGTLLVPADVAAGAPAEDLNNGVGVALAEPA